MLGPPSCTLESVLTLVLSKHSSVLAGTGGGKSFVFANLALGEYGLRQKFLQLWIFAAGCCDDDLPELGTLEEYYTHLTNLPAHVDFNPYWCVVLVKRFGGQEWRGRIHIFTNHQEFWDRVDELNAKDRKTGERKKHRPHDEKKTLVFFDDQNVSDKSPLGLIINDCRHVYHENMTVVRFIDCRVFQY